MPASQAVEREGLAVFGFILFAGKANAERRRQKRGGWIAEKGDHVGKRQGRRRFGRLDRRFDKRRLGLFLAGNRPAAVVAEQPGIATVEIALVERLQRMLDKEPFRYRFIAERKTGIEVIHQLAHDLGGQAWLIAAYIAALPGDQQAVARGDQRF